MPIPDQSTTSSPTVNSRILSSADRDAEMRNRIARRLDEFVTAHEHAAASQADVTWYRSRLDELDEVADDVLFASLCILPTPSDLDPHDFAEKVTVLDAMISIFEQRARNLPSKPTRRWWCWPWSREDGRSAACEDATQVATDLNRAVNEEIHRLPEPLLSTVIDYIRGVRIHEQAQRTGATPCEVGMRLLNAAEAVQQGLKRRHLL